MEKDMKNKKAFGVKKNPHWRGADWDEQTFHKYLSEKSPRKWG